MPAAVAYGLGFATPLVVSAALFIAIVLHEEHHVRQQRRREHATARQRWTR